MIDDALGWDLVPVTVRRDDAPLGVGSVQRFVDADGHIWGIDNGLSFAVEFKVRTVIWDFAGDPIPDELREAVSDLLDRGLPAELDELLDPFERDAITARARAFVHASCFPTDPSGRRFPWPLV